MNNASPTPTDKLLREYSALVEFWAPDAGDTHELLGGRELLEQRALSPDQRHLMEAVDAQVLRLADAQEEGSWDVLMLKKTAELIRASQAHKHAA